eukprot:NODE_75_length_23373_cov_0.434261.p7 type:complete len:310 gc:universal NODE_75_length_23373_cov_0.434261:9071-8142(-)
MIAREVIWIALLLYVLYVTKPIPKDLSAYCKGRPLNLGIAQLLICDKLIVGVCGKIYILNDVPFLAYLKMILPFVDNYGYFVSEWFNQFQQQSFKVIAFKPVWSDMLSSYVSQLNLSLEKIAHQIFIACKQPKWYEWYNGMEWEIYIKDALWLMLLTLMLYLLRVVLKRRTNLIIMAAITAFFGSYVDGPLSALSHLNLFNYMANMSFMYNLNLFDRDLSVLVVWLLSLYFGTKNSDLATPTVGTVGLEAYLMGCDSVDIIDLGFRLGWTVVVKYGFSSLFVGVPLDLMGNLKLSFAAALAGIFSKLIV